MTKRPNGSGTVEVLPDGRARVRVIVDGRRRQVGPIYPDESTARRMLDAWLRARELGDIEAPSTVSVASFGSSWLDEREVVGSRRRAVVKSLGGERSIWSRHVAESALGKLAVAAVTTRDVERFALWLRARRAVSVIHVGAGDAREKRERDTGRPLSRSMQVHALRLVRQVLDHAVREGILPANPAADVGVALGGPRPRDLSEDWLREDEIGALLSSERLSIRDRTAYACALGLALRLNDLKTIELSHVHPDAEVPGPHVRVWVEKSERWHRVPILPWLAPWLRAHIATLPVVARYLFPADDGAPYGESYDFGWAERRARRTRGRGPAKRVVLEVTPGALERAGIERRVRFHDLRGTTATHLALGTWGRAWSLHEVQAMLAHSDQRVTERYVRRAVDTLAAAARATPGGHGCPGLPVAVGDTAGQVPATTDAPGGIRTCDLSLRKPAPHEAGAALSPGHGQRVGNPALVELAEAFVLAVGAKDPLADRIGLRLAEAVLLAAAREPVSSDALDASRRKP